MGLLIKDLLDFEKFKNVIVDKLKERELKLKVVVFKKFIYIMLNGFLELVFICNELFIFFGLGLRRKIEKLFVG